MSRSEIWKLIGTLRGNLSSDSPCPSSDSESSSSEDNSGPFQRLGTQSAPRATAEVACQTEDHPLPACKKQGYKEILERSKIIMTPHAYEALRDRLEARVCPTECPCKKGNSAEEEVSNPPGYTSRVKSRVAALTAILNKSGDSSAESTEAVIDQELETISKGISETLTTDENTSQHAPGVMTEECELEVSKGEPRSTSEALAEVTSDKYTDSQYAAAAYMAYRRRYDTMITLRQGCIKGLVDVNKRIFLYRQI